MKVVFNFNYVGYREMPKNIGEYMMEIDFVPPIGTCVSAEDFMDENEMKEFIKAKKDDDAWLEIFFVCSISLVKDNSVFYYRLDLIEDIPDNQDLIKKIGVI